MSALCARKMLRPAALWCRAPPAGCARNLLTRRIQGQLQHCIKCCSDSQEGQGRGGLPEAPKSINPLGVRTWRKRRPLSPLDRVSLLIPPEYISQEIKDLQNPEQLGPPSSSSQDHPEKPSPPELSSSSSQEQLKPSRPPSFSFQDHREQLKPSQPPSSSFQDHREQLKPSQPPSSSFQDHPELLKPSQTPSSSSQDHPEQLSQPPSSSFQDHQEQLKLSQPPSSSFQDHPEQLKPSQPPSSSFQDHPEQLKPSQPPSSSFQDHQEQLKPSQPPSSSFQDHPEQLKPSQPPSSSFQDHREQLKLSQPPSSSFQDHPEQLKPSQPPSSSFQDHPYQFKPSQPPSSSFQDLPEQLKPSQPPSSSFQHHPEQLKPSQPPSSSFQDHPEQLSPPERSSSSEDHLNHPQPPSFFQKTEPLGQMPDPEPSPSPNNAPQELYSPSKTENPATLQGMPFQPQDLLIAEFKRRHYSMFRKMFVLKNSGKLVSNWGAINYQDLLGRLPGEKIRTTTGHQFLVRRPSLDEYVIYMKRGPTISYPKDVASMLTMMDVNPGDVILEAGSGSGALSLFLSRAVGPEGRVHSIEVRSDHHQVSKKNFLKWKTAWEIRSGRSWPDNVNFINKDVRDAMSDLQAVGFDAVALDMLNPHVALPAIIGNLKQGSVCAVYITNITQVIDLLEGIRSCELPLLCEKVMEVSVTDWLVAPSLRKDGRVSKRVEPQWKGSSGTLTQEQRDDEDDDESQTDDDDFAIEYQPFGQVPYIARPMPWQIGHTAFLVQLRKFKPAAELTEQTDTS